MFMGRDRYELSTESTSARRSTKVHPTVVKHSGESRSPEAAITMESKDNNFGFGESKLKSEPEQSTHLKFEVDAAFLSSSIHTDEYEKNESQLPIGKSGGHYLNVLGEHGYGKVVPITVDNKGATESNDGVDIPKMRAFTTVNVYDILDVSTLNSSFRAKVRLYMLWACDITEYDPMFERHVRRAREHGHYYSLSENEVIELLEKVPHPMDNTMFFNANDVVETDAYPGIRVYTYGMMMNMGYICNFHGNFQLDSFPFDFQEFTMDIRLNNKHKHLFDLTVHAVMFNRKALTLQEWVQMPPTVKRGDTQKDRHTNVSMIVKRKANYYVTNIVSLMTGLVTLCFSAFSVELEDIADRMSIILTLLLTAVAFKFVIADSLPKLSYSTLMDYYLLLNFVIMGWMGAVSATSAALELPNYVGLYSSLAIFSVLYLWWGITVCVVSRRTRRKLGFASSDTLTAMAKHEPNRNWFCFHFSRPPFMPTEGTT
eukprot:m.268906 g.268906  ORF g.268906 m.268906 type:complete len:485 (-) comp81239_c0_seq1:26-1480(-)